MAAAVRSACIATVLASAHVSCHLWYQSPAHTSLLSDNGSSNRHHYLLGCSNMWQACTQRQAAVHGVAANRDCLLCLLLRSSSKLCLSDAMLHLLCSPHQHDATSCKDACEQTLQRKSGILRGSCELACTRHARHELVTILLCTTKTGLLHPQTSCNLLERDWDAVAACAWQVVADVQSKTHIRNNAGMADWPRSTGEEDLTHSHC